MSRRYRYLLSLLLSVASVVLATGQDVAAPAVNVEWTNGGELLPDSSNFVTASIIVASPGEELYSQLGHSAIRMECPSYDLDYCFSFEEEPGLAGIIKFFTGKTEAHTFAVPTAAHLGYMAQDGRQVRQYTLNLTLHEKQELWRLLDSDYVSPELRHFNFLQNNCTSVSIFSIENALIDEAIDFSNCPEQMQLNGAEMLAYYTRNWDWLRFWSFTFMNNDVNFMEDVERLTGPELMPDVFKMAKIIDVDGKIRQLVIAEKELLPLTRQVKPSPITPNRVFGAFLLLTLIICLLEYKRKAIKLVRAFDFLLLALVTMVGIVLIYTSFISGLFGSDWNWYLIPFNPLPALIWLVWHKRKAFYKIYLLYAVVLLLFIAATPFVIQIDLTHDLIIGAMTARSVAKYYKFKTTINQ